MNPAHQRLIPAEAFYHPHRLCTPPELTDPLVALGLAPPPINQVRLSHLTTEQIVEQKHWRIASTFEEIVPLARLSRQYTSGLCELLSSPRPFSLHTANRIQDLSHRLYHLKVQLVPLCDYVVLTQAELKIAKEPCRCCARCIPFTLSWE